MTKFVVPPALKALLVPVAVNEATVVAEEVAAATIPPLVGDRTPPSFSQ